MALTMANGIGGWTSVDGGSSLRDLHDGEGDGMSEVGA